MAGGDAQRPVWRVNEPKKTGARKRGQNLLVRYKYRKNSHLNCRQSILLFWKKKLLRTANEVS